MDNRTVEKAMEYVKKAFACEYSGHDYFHTLRVLKNAERIAEAEGARLEIVQLAALLHDVDDRKLSPETYESQGNARRFLKSEGVDDESVNQICQIIREVSFSANGSSASSSLEGKCVQDADRLDAIGAIGIARAFAYGGSHNRHMHDPTISPKINVSREEYAKSESTTINHFYEKLFKLADLMNTDSAKKIATRREAYMKEFIAEFLSEWDGEK